MRYTVTPFGTNNGESVHTIGSDTCYSHLLSRTQQSVKISCRFWPEFTGGKATLVK